jgi:hypothetical protein
VQPLQQATKTTTEAPEAGVLALVYLDFKSGALRLTNFPLDVTALGYTWTGVGTLAEIGEMRESEDGSGETVSVGLSQVSSANLALALGNVDGYQGRTAQIYLATFSASTFQITGDPVLRFAGFMDKVRVSRDGGEGNVMLDLVTFSGDARLNPSSLRYSHAQHQIDYPGEKGFEYVADLIAKPQVWLSKTFQQV